jgi:hypothetical protein
MECGKLKGPKIYYLKSKRTRVNVSLQFGLATHFLHPFHFDLLSLNLAISQHIFLKGQLIWGYKG